MPEVAAPGRWIWGLSGLVTIAALAFPGVRLITHAWVAPATDIEPQTTVTRTVTVPQPVTSLEVQSYGSPVQVTAGPVRRVRVTETIAYSRARDAGPPAVTQSVSGGRLTLGDPVCQVSRCSVSFTVIVPSGVTVAAATEGGPLQLDGLTGPLHADTGGGPLLADDVSPPAATVITGGGDARIVFAAPPDTVLVSTDGGPATLAVPGGPYAVTANSDGGPQLVRIATDPAAGRSITVTTGGGPLVIEPPGSAS